jgi:ribonuclease HI
MSDKNMSLFGNDYEDAVTSSVQTPSKWTLHVDGASRNNPGKSGAGVYGQCAGKDVFKKGIFLGTKTNNQAEYLALLYGLFLLKKQLKKGDIVWLYSDSQLLVRQLLGQYRVKSPELIQLHKVAFGVIKEINGKIFHILREKNPIADEMANEGIDRKHPVPHDFAEYLKHHGISL